MGIGMVPAAERIPDFSEWNSVISSDPNIEIKREIVCSLGGFSIEQLEEVKRFVESMKDEKTNG